MMMRDNRKLAPPIPEEYLHPHVMTWTNNVDESERLKKYLQELFPEQLKFSIGKQRHECCADPCKNSWMEIICYNDDQDAVIDAIQNFGQENKTNL